MIAFEFRKASVSILDDQGYRDDDGRMIAQEKNQRTMAGFGRIVRLRLSLLPSSSLCCLNHPPLHFSIQKQVIVQEIIILLNEVNPLTRDVSDDEPSRPTGFKFDCYSKKIVKEYESPQPTRDLRLLDRILSKILFQEVSRNRIFMAGSGGGRSLCNNLKVGQGA